MRGHVIAAFLIALIVRVGYVVFYPQIELVNDAAAYDEVGMNLASGRGFVGGFTGGMNRETGFTIPGDGKPASPEISQGPIYPFFLSLHYRLLGHNHQAVRISQAFLSASVVFLVFILGRAVLSPSLMKTGMYLVALYPPFLIYSGLILTETVVMACLGIALVFNLMAFQTRKYYWTLLCGISYAILVLQRSEFAVLPVAFSLLWWREERWRFRGAMRPLMVVLLVALGVAPWTLRNYSVCGEWVPVSANFGTLLYLGGAPHEPMEWHFREEPLQTLTRGRSYLEASKILQRYGWESIKQRPGTYVKNSFKRVARLWGLSHAGMVAGLREKTTDYLKTGRWGRLGIKMLFLGMTWTTVLLGFMGMFSLLRSTSFSYAALLLVVPIVHKTVIHTLLFADPRYTIPVLPELLVLALVPLARFLPANEL